MKLSCWFWVFSALFWTSVMSFFSMLEMACISFNQLRLELAIHSGSRRARWIKRLLDAPTILFGTTLIGVNLGLVLSSESARRLFYELGWNPNLSPLLLAPYVIVFGDLIPLFAARQYPEHIAKLGCPALFAVSTLLSPVATVLDRTVRLLVRWVYGSARPPYHLQREELRELIEEQTESKYFDETTGQLEPLASRMFALKEKTILQLITPLDSLTALSSTSLCGPAREIVKEKDVDFALVRNRQGQPIGYVWAWDLVKAQDSASIGSFCRPTLFVGESVSVLDSLFRLKKEKNAVALVVGSGGDIVGAVSFGDIIAELTRGTRRQELHLHIEKTVSADTKIEFFAEQYRLTLPLTEAKTLGGLVEELLGHKPSVNETVHFGGLEMTVREVTIRGAKSILVKT